MRHVALLASAARTASVNSAVLNKEAEERAVHYIIDVTAVAATPSVVPTVQGYDPTSDTWYDLLVGAAITATGTTVLKVGEGIAASANVAAQDMVPMQTRVELVHADADSITYTVAANVA